MIDVEIGRTAGGHRRFPIAFRIEFVKQWHQAHERGAKVRLLRQYNLHRATAMRWIDADRQGEFTVATVAAAERAPTRVASRDRATIARQNVRIAELEKKVAQSEAVVEILGKAYELLEEITQSEQTDTEALIPPALMSADEYTRWLRSSKLS
ncbi:hypothetical protein [Tomitella biformata]|uniref:hypothetical protein n=1 Tax=Tomitella biformata TaxID=630403 RepID=UPI0004631400|nr:hypothetical protein [Tomitella biformata]